MKPRIVLLLCACSTACAELPPVVGQGGNATPNPVVNIPKSSTPLSTTYDMMKRLEQMQGEVQQLTGKVEEQAFQIEELKKQQKTMYTDFDDRLQSIENKSSSGDSTIAPAPAGNAPVVPPSVDSRAVPPESSAPAIEQSPVASTDENKPSDAVATSSESTTVPAVSDNSIQGTDAEKQEYQQAYDALRNGKTDEAISQFNNYLTAHPQSSYVSNAQYWLGEAHRVNQDNISARKAFNDVITTHPESAKVPDALLKLGYIEIEENNTVKAREYLNRVTTEYPASKAARLAEKKLLTLEASKP